MSKPVFIIQNISDHGTSNPIVARLAVQCLDLIKWIDLTQKEKDNAAKSVFDLHHKLLRCYDCLHRLELSNREALQRSSDAFSSTVVSIPYLKNLDDEVENFLTAAKHYLRDSVGTFNIVFRSALKNDSAIYWDPKGGKSAAAIWAEKEFGDDQTLASILTAHSHWISTLIKMRNAIEHPGGYSGTVVVENYKILGPTVAQPQWRRDVGGQVGKSSNILSDLGDYLIQMLEFGEDIVAQAVIRRPAYKHLQVYAIPETERDPQNPKRLRVSLDEATLKSFNDAVKD